MNASRYHRQRGFTLLEVLVAMVIVAFGLLAVFGQLNQTATAANRLRDKTIAHWIAMDRLTELRLRGDFPATGSKSDDIQMASGKWHYAITVTEAPESKAARVPIREVNVSVSAVAFPDRPVATMVGFVLQPAGPKAIPPTDGWQPLTTEAQAAAAGVPK